MMGEVELNIFGSCKIVATKWADNKSDVTIEYTEHSSSYAHSDVETDIDIDREKGSEIVAFLTKHLNL